MQKLLMARAHNCMLLIDATTYSSGQANLFKAHNGIVKGSLCRMVAHLSISQKIICIGSHNDVG